MNSLLALWPANGGCESCLEEEVNKAVDYGLRALRYDFRRISLTIWLLRGTVVVIKFTAQEVQPVFEI